MSTNMNQAMVKAGLIDNADYGALVADALSNVGFDDLIMEVETSLAEFEAYRDIRDRARLLEDDVKAARKGAMASENYQLAKQRRDGIADASMSVYNPRVAVKQIDEALRNAVEVAIAPFVAAQARFHTENDVDGAIASLANNQHLFDKDASKILKKNR